MRVWNKWINDVPTQHKLILNQSYAAETHITFKDLQLLIAMTNPSKLIVDNYSSNSKWLSRLYNYRTYDVYRSIWYNNRIVQICLFGKCDVTCKWFIHYYWIRYKLMYVCTYNLSLPTLKLGLIAVYKIE